MKEKLVTRDFCLIIAASFLLTFSFWLLMPVLPFYLIKEFGSDNTTIGIVLSCYTIAALLMRPIAGYILDTFSRKPFYLLTYFIFALIFAGYTAAGTLFVFILLRIVHGMSFGSVTVGNNTLIIDVMPVSRRGEGLGYFGLSKNVAMSIGPMTGLFIYNSGMPYIYIFLTSLAACTVGFVCAWLIRTPYAPPKVRPKIEFDRFVLIKGIPASISLMFLSIPYGMITNYLAMYCKQIGLHTSPGLFFTFMAVGMAVSRIFSGKIVDKGKVTQVISFSFYLIVCCFFLFTSTPHFVRVDHQMAVRIFYLVSCMMGVGFGILFPAYNTLFVNLAPDSQRGAATSTYLTSWDIGLGMGMIGGGYIADISNFNYAYVWGACMTVLSMLIFNFWVGPHFNRNKLR